LEDFKKNPNNLYVGKNCTTGYAGIVFNGANEIADRRMLCKLIRTYFTSHCTKSLIQEVENFSR
jgi:hypothetical protein